MNKSTVDNIDWGVIDGLFINGENSKPDGAIDYNDLMDRYNISARAARERIGKMKSMDSFDSGKYKSGSCWINYVIQKQAEH